MFVLHAVCYVSAARGEQSPLSADTIHGTAIELMALHDFGLFSRIANESRFRGLFKIRHCTIHPSKAYMFGVLEK